jgi:CopG antitoxin of type II toxin-antitoxin system
MEMKGPSLPETDSIEELARFWDSHEITQFEDQLEEVTEPVFERVRERPMVLRLEPEEAQAVKEIAKARGVEESELLREWVLEKLGSVGAGGLR